MTERRGRPKEIIDTPTARKFTKVYEDEYTVETWTYNLDKHRGPLTVDIKYKSGYDKDWDKRQHTLKQMKRIERKKNKNI